MENRGKWEKEEEEEEKYVYNVKVQLSTEKDMEPTSGVGANAAHHSALCTLHPALT